MLFDYLHKRFDSVSDSADIGSQGTMSKQSSFQRNPEPK